MDSFRGSIPPNFISFRLENQTTEVVDAPAEPTTTTTSAASLPTETGPRIQNPGVSQEQSLSRSEDITSTHSADSDPDVTLYAESMVQRMQQAQLITAQENDQLESVQLHGQEPVNDPSGVMSTTTEARKSSTPIQSDEEGIQEADLSALESALRVIEASESQLPELRNRDESDPLDGSGVQPKADEDNSSSAYFDTASPIRLPVGHTTIALTEPQMYHLLRTLTDETLRQSFNTMERMVIDAVRGTPTALPSRTSHFQLKRRAQTPGPGAQSDSESESDLAGTASDQPESSSDDSGGASFYEESDSATEMDLITKSFKQTPSRPLVGGVQADTSSSQQHIGPDTEGSSCQDTTLYEMREQAQKDQPEGHSKSRKKKGNKRLSRRGVPMREEFFSKIGWTRSFISGPADPLHNPLMVWCHICKKNFSIKSKGPYEILRHHRTDRHLRRDQRWRYEHLRSVDPVSGKVQHRVRGANGKILTKIELANQLPKFIKAELVDIGERFPFYEDFIRGTTTALVTQEARVKTQLCLVGDFIKTLGDLSVLRNMWSRMGAFTNHQATVCDFDWSEERMSVSIFLVIHPLI